MVNLWQIHSKTLSSKKFLFAIGQNKNSIYLRYEEIIFLGSKIFESLLNLLVFSVSCFIIKKCPPFKLEIWRLDSTQDDELINLIDPILASDDKNRDGFIDYSEFIQGPIL